MSPTATADSSTARIVSRADLPALWRETFQHLAKDHRYYELVEDSLPGQFEHYYLVLERDGAPRAIQPFFVVDQDLVAAASPVLRSLVNRIRASLPRLLRLRLLMVGCAAGEGHLTSADPKEQRWIAETAAKVLPEAARLHGAKLIVWKDFPMRYREGLSVLESSGEYVRVDSMPATVLPIDFQTFDEYLAKHVQRASRKSIRRKLKAAVAHGSERLVMTAHTSVTEFADELHPLYLQVYSKSALQFERLTPEFLRGIGERMGDKVRFFVWRLDGRAVAFSICLQHGDSLSDEYLGLDYSVALDLHLYYLTIRDLFLWAARNGIRRYYSTPLNYDPKLHLGFRLYPLDLYVRAIADWAQPLVGKAIRFIEPTRSEPILEVFTDRHGPAKPE